MKSISIWQMTRETIAKGIAPYLNMPLPPERIRLPGRTYAAGLYDPDGCLPEGLPACALLDAPLLAGSIRQRDWVCFLLTDAFYSACVRYIRTLLPLPPDDCGSFALNRMLALRKKPGQGCPPVAEVQRALWLLLGGEEAPAIRRAGEDAFLSMMWRYPPVKRPALLDQCGEMADACARILGSLEKETL